MPAKKFTKEKDLKLSGESKFVRMEQQKELGESTNHFKRSEKRNIFLTALLWIRKRI